MFIELVRVGCSLLACHEGLAKYQTCLIFHQPSCHKVIFIVQINQGNIEHIMISNIFLVCTLVYTVLDDRNVCDFHG